MSMMLRDGLNTYAPRMVVGQYKGMAALATSVCHTCEASARRNTVLRLLRRAPHGRRDALPTRWPSYGNSH